MCSIHSSDDKGALVQRVIGILPRLKLLGFWYQQALLDFSSLTCPTPLVDAPTSSLKIL